MAVCVIATDFAFASMTLTELEHNMDAGSGSSIFCLGPFDPWDIVASANSDPVVYWLPGSIYESTPSDAREALCAQVSSCPPWAFGVPSYTVRYLVHCLL